MYPVRPAQLCVDFQWATLLAVEQGQRWRCASYSPRSTLVVPYASTQSLATLRLRPSAERKTLLFFRCALSPFGACTLDILRDTALYCLCYRRMNGGCMASNHGTHPP